MLLNKWSWEENWERHWCLVFPDWYAGRYINQDQNAVVMVTRLDRAILSYIYDITGNRDILIKKVAYSHAELMTAMGSLREVFDNQSISRYAPELWLDDSKNNIVVSLFADEENKRLAEDDKTYVRGNIEDFLVGKLQEVLTSVRGIDSSMVVYEIITNRHVLASNVCHRN